MAAAHPGEKRRVIARRILRAAGKRAARFCEGSYERTGSRCARPEGDSLHEIAASDPAVHAKCQGSGTVFRIHLSSGPASAEYAPGKLALQGHGVNDLWRTKHIAYLAGAR